MKVTQATDFAILKQIRKVVADQLAHKITKAQYKAILKKIVKKNKPPLELKKAIIQIIQLELRQASNAIEIITQMENL